MSIAMIGGLVGMAMGFVACGVLRTVANNHERKQPGDQGRRVATILRAIAVFDVLLFTLLGYFVAPIIAG